MAYSLEGMVCGAVLWVVVREIGGSGQRCGGMRLLATRGVGPTPTSLAVQHGRASCSRRAFTKKRSEEMDYGDCCCDTFDFVSQPHGLSSPLNDA